MEYRLNDVGIKIDILNVGDADAIIVTLNRADERLVMLIDGGRIGDTELVINELNVVLASAGKQGPDIVICTHYDGDHIGGLKGVINYYKDNIGLVFIHRISEVLNITNENEISGGILPLEDDLVLYDFEFYMDVRTEENLGKVLETIKQEKELIELINQLGIEIREPFADVEVHNKWKEIKILGPTVDFYKTLFKINFDRDKFLKEEVESLGPINNSEKVAYSCDQLQALSKSRVSPTNLNSVILRIDIGDKIFLFAADAGIESFYKIPNYLKVLKNIFWMKVPHHGSRNNINKELIELMSLKHAVISGNKHVDESVLNCLRSHGVNVCVTRDCKGNISYKW
jgi:beta-lactamase superfamily II metal-dependent hydrolase